MHRTGAGTGEQATVGCAHGLCALHAPRVPGVRPGLPPGHPPLPAAGQAGPGDTAGQTPVSPGQYQQQACRVPGQRTIAIDESEQVKRVFRPLQLLTACFGALSHGSNDVGNCIGPW